MKAATIQPMLIAWVAAALFLALLLPKINSGNLWHHDELLTGNRAREMLLRGDPFSITLDFQPDFKKPPLQYWLSALALRTFPGHPELAVRLPATLYGAGCLLALAWMARRCFPDETGLGEWSVLALAGCGYFIQYSRVGLLDTGAAFHLTLAVGGCWLARQSPRWWWFVALQTVLGAWQKMPFALAAWLVILLFRWARTKRNSIAPPIFSRHLAGALVVAVAATAAWPMLQVVRYGAGPLTLAAHGQMAKLVNVHELNHAGFEPYSYWWWLVRDWAAVGVCVPLALLSIWWRRSRNAPQWDESMLELGVVCGLFFLPLLAIPYHTEHYLVPITPLLALLCVRWLLGVVPHLPLAARWHTWVVAALILTTVPAAAFHYLSRFPTDPDLLAAAQDLRQGLAEGEEVIIDDEPDYNVSPAGFISFYAKLRHAPLSHNHAQVRQLFASPPAGANDRNLSGICPRSDLPAMPTAFITRISAHGDWVYWQHRVGG